MASKAFSLKKGARSLKGVFHEAISPEIDHIVDELDEGNIATTDYEVADEVIVKRLGTYHG